MKNSPLWFTGQVPANHRGLLAFMKDWSRSGGEFDSPYWKKDFLHLRFRYFEKTELDFRLSNFLGYIFLASSHLRKNTAFSCGIFAAHLFYQHILESVPTFEPAAQEAGRRHLQSIGMTGFFNIYSQRTTKLIRLWRLYFLVFLGSI